MLPHAAPALEPWPHSPVTVRLEPLSALEVRQFVLSRLSDAGCRTDLFEPEAIAAVAHHSAGLLRLVIVLAGASMFFATHDGAPRVTCQHVEDASSMRDPSGSSETGKADLASALVHDDAPITSLRSVPRLAALTGVALLLSAALAAMLALVEATAPAGQHDYILVPASAAPNQLTLISA